MDMVMKSRDEPFLYTFVKAPRHSPDVSIVSQSQTLPLPHTAGRTVLRNLPHSLRISSWRLLKRVSLVFPGKCTPHPRSRRVPNDIIKPEVNAFGAKTAAPAKPAPGPRPLHEAR